jgi:hypothetical protein
MQATTFHSFVVRSLPLPLLLALVSLHVLIVLGRRLSDAAGGGNHKLYPFAMFTIAVSR